MNILIYIPEFGKDWGGVKQYSSTLLGIIKEDHHNHYFVYNDLKDPAVSDLIRDIPLHTVVNPQEINRPDNKIKKFYIRVFNFLFRILRIKQRVVLPDNFSSFCEKKSIQIIHCPYQYIPATKAAKLITTMHDVQELHFPEFFTAEARAFRARVYLDYLRRTDAVIVSYQHIKNDLVKYFQVPEQKINIILLEMDKLWFQSYLQSEPITLPEQFQHMRYLFYPANTWEHKNHIALLEAISSLKKEENLVINLICTGQVTEQQGTRILKKISDMNISEHVHFPGLVDESLLYSIYKNAVGVVIPTLYEAGSFPLMESIFLGVPVICSNVTSLPETMGDEDFTFDPTDNLALKNKMKRLWLDESFRKKSIANSLIQKNKLTKTDALRKIIKTYEDVLSQ